MFSSLGRYLLFILMSCGMHAYAQDMEDQAIDYRPVVESTSATDDKIRIEKSKRVKKSGDTQVRHNKSVKKRKAPGSKSKAKEAKVYKKHGHFASRDIRLRSKSKSARKESLGVGTD
jgi:hypothetical protein